MSKEDLLADLVSYYYEAYGQWVELGTHINSAWAFWPGTYGSTRSCLQSIILGLEDLQVALGGLIKQDNTTYPYYYILQYLHLYSGADVTYKSICEAWVADDFEGKYWTIACIDRMRQLIWDKPFDIIWAGKPEAKEI